MRAHEFIISESSTVDEYVNPETVQPEFHKEKEIMGKYRMVAHGRENANQDGVYGILVTVYDPEQPTWQDIAKGRFIVQGPKGQPNPDRDHIEVSMVHVDREYQRQGIASAMYQFVRELGNEIKPSRARTAQGKAFWAGGAGVGRDFPEQPIPPKVEKPVVPKAEPKHGFFSNLSKMLKPNLGLRT